MQVACGEIRGESLYCNSGPLSEQVTLFASGAGLILGWEPFTFPDQ